MKTTCLAIALALLSVSHTGQAAVLADNLGASTANTERVTTTRWVNASFQTGASGDTLASVVIAVRDATDFGAGHAEADIYVGTTDFPGAPVSLLGALTPPLGISSSFEHAEFGGAGLQLAASTTYWVVLHALDGNFEWQSTSDNTGNGPGFLPSWGNSDDSGATWSTFGTAPMQMQVNVGAVPLPSPAFSLMSGLGVLGVRGLRRKATGR